MIQEAMILTTLMMIRSQESKNNKQKDKKIQKIKL